MNIEYNQEVRSELNTSINALQDVQNVLTTRSNDNPNEELQEKIKMHQELILAMQYTLRDMKKDFI